MATATAQMAEQHPDIVVGVVSQQKLLSSAGQLHFTPGEIHVMSTWCDIYGLLKVFAYLE